MSSGIKRIEFGLVDPKKLKKTCFIIESSEMWDQNTPQKGGLFDLHMGTIDRRYVCQTCGQKEFDCPGHMGGIEICMECYIPNLLDATIKALRSICPDCSALLMNPADVKKRKLDWISDEISKKAAHRFCIYGHPEYEDSSEGDLSSSEEASGCGAHRASYTRVDGLSIKMIQYELEEAVEDEADEEAPEEAPVSGKRRKTSTKRKKKPKYVSKEIIVTPRKAYNMLRKISPVHARLMGFGEGQHPSWMIWSSIVPIVPPSERPSIQMSAQRRGEDDLTCAAFNIFKSNAELEKKIAQGCQASQLSSNYQLLQFRVGTYTTNEMQKMPKAKQRSGRESQGIAQKLKGKEGLVRGHQVGKRVNFSGRSVITGDPSLSITEIGVPLEMAMVLTKPIPVTAENIDECLERVMIGPWVFGGASTIIKHIKGRQVIVDLKLAQTRTNTILRPGMTIEIHLENGDWLLFNRQPTLHRLGMMAHQVKIVPGSTLRMNECVTPPYNAGKCC